MRKLLIAPSILNADYAHLGKLVKELEAGGADLLHLDVMDGHFVRNITFGQAVVSSIRKVTSLPLETHLMIERPDLYVEQFGDAGSDRLIIHRESDCNIQYTLKEISKNGMETGIAINPDSELKSVYPFLHKVDMLLVMSINPGFGGQKFMPKSIGRIRQASRYINEKELKVRIGVDGGVKKENARKIWEAGADELIAGTAIVRSGNIKKAIREFRSACGR